MSRDTASYRRHFRRNRPGRAAGRSQEGERLAQQALARADETHNNTGPIYGHMFLAVIAVHTGDMQRLLLESQRTLQLAEASGDQLYCYFSHGYQALAYSRLGNHAAAVENLTRQHTSSDFTLVNRARLASRSVIHVARRTRRSPQREERA